MSEKINKIDEKKDEVKNVDEMKNDDKKVDGMKNNDKKVDEMKNNDKKVDEMKNNDKKVESNDVEEKDNNKIVEENETQKIEKNEDKKVEKKESSFLTSTITKKDDVVLGSEDIELKGLQEKFIESNLKDEVLFKSKCLLFIFNKEKKKFEERGPGDIMINKEKETEMVKVVMIRESIMRFGCNHYINPRHKLIKNDNVNNGWVWATTEDTVDDEVNKKKFYLVKFDSNEDTDKFKEEYEKGRITNKEILER